MQELVSLISTMDKEQLRVASKLLKERWNYLSQLEKYQFSVGDKVEFSDRGGKVQTGIVTKIMKKNVRVKTSTDEWTIAPSLLRKEETI